MLRRNKKKELPEKTNNIWNSYDFNMCGQGEKCKLWAKIKHIKRCLRWSRQRIVRGYSDSDIWDMYGYLQTLLPDMLQNLKDNRHGSPDFLGENYTNDEGILVNETCHEEWDKILDRMIFLWKESDEDVCSKKNPYEDEYSKASDEFAEKYGFWGERLQTEEQLEENHKRGGGGTIHFMDEVSEYKEISDKYREEEQKLEQYRNECKDEALDMLKKYFFALWD
ncbi:MAG: hypothetical protein NC307_08915 [Roseburia sp.]|nr:hypothetical protein [Roseburia sp.]